MRNERGSYIIRLVAGAYLLYLAYSLVKSLIAGEVEQPTLVMIAAAAFIILGAALLVWGLRGVMQMSKNPADEEEIEADAEVVEAQESLPEDTAESEVIEAADTAQEDQGSAVEAADSPEPAKQEENE